jgi:hypothetical protein
MGSDWVSPVRGLGPITGGMVTWTKHHTSLNAMLEQNRGVQLEFG